MAEASSSERKIVKVMHEFKRGRLRSSSGQVVKKHKQAIAIALSGSGQSRGQKDNGPRQGAAKNARP